MNKRNKILLVILVLIIVIPAVFIITEYVKSQNMGVISYTSNLESFSIETDYDAGGLGVTERTCVDRFVEIRPNYDKAKDEGIKFSCKLTGANYIQYKNTMVSYCICDMGMTVAKS